MLSPSRLHSCLEHLLDNGADPSMVNSKGYSAVHYAAYHGNKQNLELVSVVTSSSVYISPVTEKRMRLNKNALKQKHANSHYLLLSC